MRTEEKDEEEQHMLLKMYAHHAAKETLKYKEIRETQSGGPKK